MLADDLVSEVNGVDYPCRRKDNGSRRGSVIQVKALIFDVKMPFSFREISKGLCQNGRIANLWAEEQRLADQARKIGA
jgi:hypothetical protein